MRRAVSMLISGAVLVAVAYAAYWAGTNAVVPPELPVAAHPSETYTVETGTVGRSVRVSIAAKWSTIRTLYGAIDGIVTSVGHQAGDAAQRGDVLLTVNLEPVVVARGAVPMFRTLEQGMDGPDVAQFQRLLRSLGFFPGPTNGVFDPATAAATKRWQRSIGATADGTVESGSLLFVDALPARMTVVPSVGAQIGAGTELVRVLEHAPRFTVTVSGSQRAELRSGLTIAIDAPGGGTWTGTPWAPSSSSATGATSHRSQGPCAEAHATASRWTARPPSPDRSCSCQTRVASSYQRRPSSNSPRALLR